MVAFGSREPVHREQGFTTKEQKQIPRTLISSLDLPLEFPIKNKKTYSKKLVGRGWLQASFPPSRDTVSAGDIALLGLPDQLSTKASALTVPLWLWDLRSTNVRGTAQVHRPKPLSKAKLKHHRGTI